VAYARDFALAGLKLDSNTEGAPGGFIGVDTHNREIPPSEMPSGSRGGRGSGRGGAPLPQLMVTDIAAGAPAASSGLKAGDRIVDVDGTAATAPVLNETINAKKVGEKIKLRVSRGGTEQDLEVEVAHSSKKTIASHQPREPQPPKTRS
jgi:C-terminal processing protease CtpA/Prc